ncbi:MAG: DUF1549 domain-containing protein [Pirellulaceae bacterium]
MVRVVKSIDWVVLICVLALSPLLVSGAESDVVDQPKAASVNQLPLRKILSRSRKIDALIETDCAENSIELNPITGDEVFLRRIYLDVIGRIPTYTEAVQFLDSEDPKKRSKLIDKLLDSEGYVSHQFNWWADLLRIQSRMRYGTAQPYIDFVKQSLRENKPYDQFVRDLITPEGYTWDNGAAGYYLRDSGMPLDNMSNTAQVFLGTQLVCAQCHDHPFDSWTQRQYYELAAFTYGVETRDRQAPMYREFQKMRRGGEIERNILQAAGQILQPLAYRVHETDRVLRLPKDYQYDDAKPGAPIQPATIFGDEVKVPENASRKEIYAIWMTSSNNKRFVTVIANRLWKRTMGLALVEPIDDFKDGVDASNPQLMEFLARKVVDLEFDLKQFQRMLYNTQTYQRDVSAKEVLAGEHYYFPGPVLRRMTAEQVWDSMLTLIVPVLDERRGIPAANRYATSGEELVEKDMKEILKMAADRAKVREVQSKYQRATSDLQRQLRVAYRTQDREKITDLRDEMKEIRQEIYGRQGEMMMQRDRNRAVQSRRETDPRWVGLSRDFVRASETQLPARPGHFLRQFGQSDRETIENSNTEATVPQILTMLNGPMFSQLSNRNSLLYKNIADADGPVDTLDVVFVSILSRRPTEREREITREQVDSGLRGTGDIVWALINTRQFLFVR